MSEETLYSAPVETSADKEKESSDCYETAAFYLSKGEYREAEQKLLSYLNTDDALSAENYPLCLLLLGKMYLSGQTSAGKPDYMRAIQYLEQGLELAPEQGREYAGSLGEAYEAVGRKINAIHWYRVAAEEFEQEQYKEPLYRLYLTGIAGAAKKREAEEYML